MWRIELTMLLRSVEQSLSETHLHKQIIPQYNWVERTDFSKCKYRLRWVLFVAKPFVGRGAQASDAFVQKSLHREAVQRLLVLLIGRA